MARPVLGALLFFCACRPATILVEPWAADRTVVLEVLDEGQHALSDTPLVLRGDGPFEVDLPAKRVQLVALEFPPRAAGGPDFDACGLTYTEGGVQAVTSTIWTSALGEFHTGDSIALTRGHGPYGPAIWLPSCPPAPCAHVPGMLVGLSTTTGTRPIAALIGPQRAVIGGFAGEPLLQIATSSGSVHPIVVPGLTGVVTSLAYDQAGTVHGLSNAGTYFQLDAATLAVTLSATTSLIALSGGLDGTVVGFDGSGVYALTRGSTALAPISKSPPPGLNSLRVATASRMLGLATIPSGYNLYSFNGSGWASDFIAGSALQPPAGSAPPQLAGDQNRWLVVSPGGVAIRAMSDLVWTTLDDPISGLCESRVGAAYGTDGVLVYGSCGEALFWDGKQWCPAPSTGMVESSFGDLQVTPDGRGAIALTRQSVGTDKIFAVFFSPPPR
jgi:hypothetical protein